ncbi:septal ring lytic transglycosylase RlpA family protein [Roseateles saccharophilus]|uniref:Endolytic peptidoglycan transglycosylase RlpA n=1 Tax=Roseateles saccharophilus TaxID=304 RepID=A0A4V2VPD0_ROSSA|nr:septal ring lytic transglycosylase RlpA family protein [Roseateles saccharophilus]TCU88980.1 rare lipoprotein A [Roseateles saccharophilus]
MLALMTGCATRPVAPAADRDGAPASPPAELHKVPDAEPRVEPIRSGGPNKPYEVAGEHYEPITTDAPYAERGLASWYGNKFHGRPTSSGEVYNMYAMTAAHATLPIPSYARVRNPANGREVVVRINDRGPFHKGRIIDLSYTAALKLDLLRGVAPVEVKRITYAEIRAGAWQKPANEPPPTFVPEVPPGSPQRETTATVAATVTTGPGYWLQFGAFGRLDGAEALRQRVAEADLGLLPLLTIVREAGLNRLRAGPFPSADEARSMADKLRTESGLESSLVEKR